MHNIKYYVYFKKITSFNFKFFQTMLGESMQILMSTKNK